MKAGDVAAEFIDKQLTYLRDRRSSIETRAISLITIAALPAPIAAAFVTLAAPGKAVNGVALIGAVTAVAALVAAAGCGLLAMAPRTSNDVVAPPSLRPLVSEEYWDRPPEQARRAIAVLQLQMTSTTDTLVTHKGKWLRAGFGFAVLGLVLLAVTVLLVTRGP
ncbi:MULTISPECIES: hypothetical protein [unclassified Streptomyces]|uniref:hypothetical protein n=1 Tax=unclassified Streptomyces TaxID=2593676 RepID=UPI0004C95DC0|nr:MULTISPECIES: hypothetical protein [unclassified Streptomyces]KJY18394.1 hypothetical protein VR43_25230 [Streptomyces sp. NRRL S-104]